MSRHHTGREIRQVYGDNEPERVNLTRLWREYQKLQPHERGGWLAKHPEKVQRNVLAADCTVEWWDNFMASEVSQEPFGLKIKGYSNPFERMSEAADNRDYKDCLRQLLWGVDSTLLNTMWDWGKRQTHAPLSSYALLDERLGLSERGEEEVPYTFLHRGQVTSTRFPFTILAALPDMYRQAGGGKLSAEHYLSLAREVMSFALNVSRLELHYFGALGGELYSHTGNAGELGTMKHGAMDIQFDENGWPHLRILSGPILRATESLGDGTPLETGCPASAGISEAAGVTVTQAQGQWIMDLLERYVVPHLDKFD